MRVLVVGGGGREHAIVWSLEKSPRVSKLYCAPGNAGIAKIAECVNLQATDVDGMVSFARENAVDFVVVSPDDPLALGMVDALDAAGIRAFGPRKDAARIESSKVFSKDLMKKYGIPTAKYAVFSNAVEAKAYIHTSETPLVVKADGLALGKGVVVAMDEEAAFEAIDAMLLDRKFGDSGNHVIVEECMTGPEVTVLAFTDGKTIVPMLSSQDHKRAYTGNHGPNTGGMGAFCPSPLYTQEVADLCELTIIRPTFDALKKEGCPFKGVIYFGLMLTARGPRVIEYNARFGDPEAQAVLTMLETDLLDILEAVVDERLDEIDIKWRDGYSCCVVMASGGYPGRFEKGLQITGLGDVPDNVTIFHAGTAVPYGTPDMDWAFQTNGGRVMGVTALGDTLEQAANRAYDGVGCIHYDNMYFRTDIGRAPAGPNE